MLGFTNISIKNKIMFIALAGVLGFCFYLVFSYNVASDNASHLDDIQHTYFPVLEKSNASAAALTRLINTLSAAINSEDEELIEEAQDDFERIKKNLQSIKELSPQYAEDSDRLNGLLIDYFGYAKEFALGMIEGTIDLNTAKSNITTMQVIQQNLIDEITAFREKLVAEFEKTIFEMNDISQRALMLGTILAVALAILLGGLGKYISSSIASSITGVATSLEELAQGDGDLRLRLECKHNDEVGRLVDGFNAFIEQLHGIVSELVGSITSLSSAANQMAAITEDSSVNIKKQQQDIKQVESAMDSMSSVVQNIAQSASEASYAANETDEETNNGKQVVSSTINSLNELASDVEQAAKVIQDLEKKSEDAGAVLDVIKSVAEQTNLLALNAAIEAARAGEQGRGFSVVADEVRTLAQRTQTSAIEIEATIEQLQQQAATANKVMMEGCNRAQTSMKEGEKASTALENITMKVSKINDMIREIAAAGEEQSSTTEEINSNVMNIGQVAEMNADSSRQISNAGEDLSKLSSQLYQLIGRFKV